MTSKHTKRGRKERRRAYHEGIVMDAMERQGATRLGLSDRLHLDDEEPTAFAYSPDLSARVVLDEQSWARFCAAADLNLDGSPREDGAL